MGTRRLTRPEVEILRRSLAASGGLPRTEIERLIGETDRLLAEQARLSGVIDDLRGSWPELRRVLNELNALVEANRDDA